MYIREFFTPALADVFPLILNGSKSPQVSRTLLSILADFNNAVVWMVSTRPLISKSSSPSTNPLVTVLNAPITIGMTVTFIFYRFSILQKGLGTYLSFRFNSMTNRCTLLLKERSKTNEWTRILVSSKNFNNSQRDNPCTVSRTNGSKQLKMLEK